jgi:hypothetical protein
MHFVQLHQVVVFAERDGPCDAGHHQSEDVGIPALEEQEEDDVELEELLVRLGGQVVAVLSLQGRVPGHFPLQGFHQFGTAVRGEVAALGGQCLPGCDQDRHLYSGKSSGNVSCQQSTHPNEIWLGDGAKRIQRSCDNTTVFRYLNCFLSFVLRLQTKCNYQRHYV